jgi:glutamate decarboxylase
VLGANVQVCWEKFCRCWEIEPRIVAVGGGAVLGSTFDGSYEPVQELAAALDALAAGGGPDVPGTSRWSG